MWGQSPLITKQQLESGEISLQNVMNAILLKAADSQDPENIFTYLDLEGTAAINDRKHKAKELNELLKMTTDKESRRKILDQLKELNKR